MARLLLLLHRLLGDWSGGGDGGQVGLRDLLLVMARTSGEEMWRVVFDKFDIDGDGFVTPTEYVTIMTQIYGGQPPSDDEVDATFSAVDDDRDGRISYDGSQCHYIHARTEWSKMYATTFLSNSGAEHLQDKVSLLRISCQPVRGIVLKGTWEDARS